MLKFVRLLDFEAVHTKNFTIPQDYKANHVIAADIVYGLHLAEWVPSVAEEILLPHGTLWTMLPKSRWVRKLFSTNHLNIKICRESMNLLKIWKKRDFT